MKKSRFFIRRFNLIEITMAIAVVGIGIAGIMALFPPALNANKSAVNFSFASNIIEEIAALVEDLGDQNWSSLALPTSKPTYDTNDQSYDFTGSGINGYPGIYAISNGKYAVKSADDSFKGLAMVWSTTLPSSDDLGKTTLTNEGDAAANCKRVYIELSWPLQIPEQQREKRTYIIDLYNPDYLPAEGL